MIKIERTEVFNLEGAIRGARNPMNSWERSDSRKGCDKCDIPNECFAECPGGYGFILGTKDLAFARGLIKAGTDHRKFLRQIFVSVDITAPLYWWKEYDTYKVGTVSNSCSTMHKIHAKSFERADFSCDRMSEDALTCLDSVIALLEKQRVKFVETKELSYWHDMIQLLPSSYNQMRTCTLNYENLLNIYYARRHHKLMEWHTLCDWILTLPYFPEMCLGGETDSE